jgi:hypothetical protein
MKYEKPEIVVTVEAVSAIQGMEKDGGVKDNTLHLPSIPAYEADE